MRKTWLLLAAMLTSFAAHATITGTASTVSFACANSSGPYPFTFPVLDSGSIFVIEIVNGSPPGVMTVLPSNQWTSTPVNQNYANGGSVILTQPCPSGDTLWIARVTEPTQLTDYVPNMPALYATVENSLDQLTTGRQDTFRVDQLYIGQVTTGGTSGTASMTYTPLGQFINLNFPTAGGGGGGGSIPQFGTYGTDACASIQSLITLAGMGTAGGAMQFTGPFTTVPCAFNSAGAAPYGAFSYSQASHAPIGPSFYLNLGSVAIKTDVQWVNPFKSTLFGNAMISGSSGGTTILASNNFVPWLHNVVVSGSAPLLTITGGDALTAQGNPAVYPFGLTGGNFIKIVGTGTCLDNAWRVDSSTGSSITFYYVQPGSGCTPPSLPVTVTKTYVPLVINGNSSAGSGTPGYGGVDAGALIHDLAIDCNPQGAANAPHPQNCIAMAGFTWNEGSGIENVDLKNTTSIGLDIEVPALYGTGATGHPADYFVRNTNILVDPFYTNNPTTNVDKSICEYVNTHGDPFWYDMGGTCKVVSGGSQAADAIQVIGTQGGAFIGKHIEGFQTCVHFIAPTAPEVSLNRAIKVLNETCGAFYTATGTPNNVLIDSGSGFPIDLETITGLPAGGAIVSDNNSGFNTVYAGGDTVDAFLNHYASVGAGQWRIDSGSFASSIAGGGDSWWASSGGGTLTLGNNTGGVLTPYGKIRSVSSGFVFSNENAGGGPLFFRPTGTSNATPEYTMGKTTFDLWGTGASFPLSITLPTAFTAMRTLNPQDLNGTWPVQDTAHTSGLCYLATGQLGACPSGTFTTTNVTSETVTLTGCTVASHAWVQATNATAAALTGVFISAVGTNNFTLAHSATAGGTFNTFCTAN
jgi:hypothetical protein